MSYEHTHWCYSGCWILIFAQEALFLHLFLSGQAPTLLWRHLYKSDSNKMYCRLKSPSAKYHMAAICHILCEPEIWPYCCEKPWGLRCIFIRYSDFKLFENCISSRGKICWMASSPTLGNLWAFQYFRYFHRQIGTSRISPMIYHQQCSV